MLTRKTVRNVLIFNGANSFIRLIKYFCRKAVANLYAGLNALNVHLFLKAHLHFHRLTLCRYPVKKSRWLGGLESRHLNPANRVDV